MIGYYVHHVGQGHLQQALTVAAVSSDQFTVLSSLQRPASYRGPWVQLPRDDAGPASTDPTAGGHLHWAPVGDAGLRARMAMIAEWIQTARPSAIVVDVSVEVSAFARLMGVPVIGFVLPGNRADSAHRLGYALTEQLIAPWPQSFDAELVDATQPWSAKMRHVGAFSRFDGRPAAQRPGGRPVVVLLHGRGGSTLTRSDVASARAATPEWDWKIIGGSDGAWMDDPWPVLSAADVVVTHAGLNAVAEVAAARRPAVVIPQPRPHDEQFRTAHALGESGLAVTLERWPPAGEWPHLLQTAQRRGGHRWHSWSAGDGAIRAAAIIESVALHEPPPDTGGADRPTVAGTTSDRPTGATPTPDRGATPRQQARNDRQQPHRTVLKGPH
jgi:hypothetical protein